MYPLKYHLTWHIFFFGKSTRTLLYFLQQKADLAVAGITITSAREQYVDFTKPFWSLGITILFRKPKPKPIRLFSFLDPFHEDVWVYMIAIYLCVSFMFFVIARLTPYEWCNPYPCNQDEDIVENQFSVLNSMWLTIGSILQQGKCNLEDKCALQFVKVQIQYA